MKILSEKTNKEYESVEACLEDERLYDEEQQKIKAEREALVSEKRERAKEVEEAYASYREAYRKYIELRNAFINDYGYFHMTYRNNESVPEIDGLFDAYKQFLDRWFD